MTKINTGGPAFPATENHEYFGLADFKGMTLRDYAAFHADGLDEDADAKYAAVFNPDPKPYNADYLGWAKWFAKADARLRYIRADAMIAARDKYGISSERRARLIDKLELQLEELEATATEDALARAAGWTPC